MKAMDKIAEFLEDVTRLHTSKILYCNIKKLGRNRQSGLVTVKDRNGATTNDKKSTKEGFSEHSDNVLNRDS